MDLYQLFDGIQIFQASNSKKLIIRNYRNGTKISVNNQKLLLKLLLSMKRPISKQEIMQSNPRLLESSLDETLRRLIGIGVVNVIGSPKTRELSVLIIGLGTTGSFLADGICRNLTDVRLHLVDPDVVDVSNIGRQVYLMQDVGLFKVDVIRRNFKNSEIKTFKSFIDSESELEVICRRENIDLVVQCGDQPSPRYLGNIVSSVCDKVNIPYIINTGYISSLVPLPEFYYPRRDYNFNYKHHSGDEKLLLSQNLTKPTYNLAIQPTHIMLKQIEQFMKQQVPIYYRFRGYYNVDTLKWEVEKID